MIGAIPGAQDAGSEEIIFSVEDTIRPRCEDRDHYAAHAWLGILPLPVAVVIPIDHAGDSVQRLQAEAQADRAAIVQIHDLLWRRHSGKSCRQDDTHDVDARGQSDDLIEAIRVTDSNLSQNIALPHLHHHPHQPPKPHGSKKPATDLIP